MRRTFARIAVLCVLASTRISAAETGKLCGKLVDITGVFVPHGAVYALPEYPSNVFYRMQADEQGKFCFADLPRGAYCVYVEVRGFAPKTFKMRIHGGSEETTGSLTLEPTCDGPLVAICDPVLPAKPPRAKKSTPATQRKPRNASL